MAENRIDLGSDVDLSWIDRIEDPKAREFVREFVATTIEPKVKNLQRGMSLAQQKASAYEKDLLEWQKFHSTWVAPYKQLWERAPEWLPLASQMPPEEFVGNLQRKPTHGNNRQQGANFGDQDARARATKGMESLREAYKAGEIDIEQLQKFSQQTVDHLYSVTGDLADVSSFVQEEIPRMRQSYESVVTDLKAARDEVGKMRDDYIADQRFLIPTMLRAAKYQVAHPDRDIERVAQFMGQENVSFDDAVHRLYGGQDEKSLRETKEHEWREEFEKKQQEQQNPELAPIRSGPSMIFRRPRPGQPTTPEKPPTTEAGVREATWGVLTREGR